MERGEFPERELDHEDGDRANSRIGNLRPATTQLNAANRKVQANNKCGHKGVAFVKSRGKFKAQIGVDGKGVHLGYYLTVEEASEAYKRAADRYFGEFAYHNRRST